MEEALGHAATALKQAMTGDRARIGIVLGADATNEDNYVAARLALEFLEAPALYLGAEPAGTAGDDFLRDNDPNPNRAGATACGRGKLRTSEQLAQDLEQGQLSVLYVVGDRLHLSPEALARAARLELFAVQATHPSPMVEQAQVVLPAAMWPEVDGTITNRQGKVQRLRAAVPPPDVARPHWQILVQVARRAGLTLDHAGPQEIFAAMQQELAPFKDAQWGKAMAPQLLRYAGSRG